MNFRSWQHSYTWCPAPAKNSGTRYELKMVACLTALASGPTQTNSWFRSANASKWTHAASTYRKGSHACCAAWKERTFVLKESLQQFISLLFLTKKQNTSMRIWPKRSCSKGTAALVLWSFCSHLNFTFRMAGIFCFADICKETFYQKTLEFFNKTTSASLKCFKKKKKKRKKL